MGSSRLPGKVMKKINNEIPMLKFQMNQLKFSKYIDKIIIATTTLENDDFIVSFCEQNNIEHFRGSSKDVLGRYYNCSRKFRLPTIVRITSDNPLIDPEIVDDVINEFNFLREHRVQERAYQSTGPFNVGGRTRAAIIDVRNENTIIAGGVSGGIWKTTNGGNEWTRVSDPELTNSITCMAQDTRTGKENIIFQRIMKIPAPSFPTFRYGRDGP